MKRDQTSHVGATSPSCSRVDSSWNASSFVCCRLSNLHHTKVGDGNKNDKQWFNASRSFTAEVMHEPLSSRTTDVSNNKHYLSPYSTTFLCAYERQKIILTKVSRPAQTDIEFSTSETILFYNYLHRRMM